MTGKKGKGNDKSGVRRRDVLLAGAGGAAVASGAAGVFGPIAGAAAAALTGNEKTRTGPSVNGVVRTVSETSILIADPHTSLDWASNGLAPASTELELSINSESFFYKDGPAAVTSFVPGDRVIAFVQPSDTGVVASAVEPVYVGVEGSVTGWGDSELSTSAGSILLTDNTLVRGSKDEEPTSIGSVSEESRASMLKGLTQIEATCRVDPESGKYVAANVAQAWAS